MGITDFSPHCLSNLINLAPIKIFHPTWKKKNPTCFTSIFLNHFYYSYQDFRRRFEIKNLWNISFWKCGSETFFSPFSSLPRCHIYHGANSCQRLSGWVTAFTGSTRVLETRSSSSAAQGLCWHKRDQNSPFCLPFSWITPSQTNCHLSLHTFNGTLHWCCLFFPLPSSPVTLLCANLFFQASGGSLNDGATAI